MTEKEQFLGAVEREFPTTMKVLKAFPPAKADMKPQAKCRSAKDLAWAFVVEEKAGEQALDGAIDFGKLPAPPRDKAARPLHGGEHDADKEYDTKNQRAGGARPGYVPRGPLAPVFADFPPERRWRLVLARARRYDGAFVYAVRSTGIYCRP